MARALTRPEEQRLRDEIANGGRPTVWFTAAAVGVRAGASAKVLTFTEPAEGDYIQVRPTGSKDVLSFSPEEITLDRPARTPKAARVPKSEPELTPVAAVVQPPAEPRQAPSGEPTAEPSGTRRSAPSGEPAAVRRGQDTETTSPATEMPRRKETAKVSETSRGRRPAASGLVVTLSATLDGEWLAEVTGARKRVRGAQVSPGAMAKIAPHLPPEINEAVETVLATTREQAKARVESLKAELQAAEKAFKDLAR